MIGQPAALADGMRVRTYGKMSTIGKQAGGQFIACVLCKSIDNFWELRCVGRIDAIALTTYTVYWYADAVYARIRTYPTYGIC